MVRAAVEALPGTRRSPAVTVLTSLTDASSSTPSASPARRATPSAGSPVLAVEAGARALVCSPHEVAAVRRRGRTRHHAHHARGAARRRRRRRPGAGRDAASRRSPTAPTCSSSAGRSPVRTDVAARARSRVAALTLVLRSTPSRDAASPTGDVAPTFGRSRAVPDVALLARRSQSLGSASSPVRCSDAEVTCCGTAAADPRAAGGRPREGRDRAPGAGRGEEPAQALRCLADRGAQGRRRERRHRRQDEGRRPSSSRCPASARSGPARSWRSSASPRPAGSAGSAPSSSRPSSGSSAAQPERRRPADSARLTVLSGPVRRRQEHRRARRCAPQHPEVWLSVVGDHAVPAARRDRRRAVPLRRPASEFDALVAEGELLEWAEFAGNRYGTPRAPVMDQLAAGRPGAAGDRPAGRPAGPRARCPRRQLVFLAPPSLGRAGPPARPAAAPSRPTSSSAGSTVARERAGRRGRVRRRRGQHDRPGRRSTDW